MKLWKGVAASGGVAEGYACFVSGQSSAVPARRMVEDLAQEEQRFELACARTKEELQRLQRLAQEQVGPKEGDIFLAHQAMLEDLELQEQIRQGIRRGLNAEVALYDAVESFAKLFDDIEDDYLRERGMDLRDVSQRLMEQLDSPKEHSLSLPEKTIVLARDLLPSQTIQLDAAKVQAFVTMAGSPNSHAAILARSRDIPAVVALGEGLENIPEGSYLIVDGDSGTVYENPDPDIVAWFREKQAQQAGLRAQQERRSQGESRTQSGRSVQIMANISTLEDVGEALQLGCDGVGLTRSEFLYMQRDHWPDEESQFAYYKEVLQSMAGRRVIIRSCDLGMDKQVSYLEGDKEENPALGLRGIRLSTKRPEVFFTQIRALLRASAYGSLGIMFPMITNEWELDYALELCREAKELLESEGVPLGQDLLYGIMVETPAAAILSPRLAKKADFFSIGTNDLIQYTLCVDRVNPAVAALYDPCHPAVLELVGRIIRAIHGEGKPCGICGDAATEPAFARKAIALGIDSLSVPPRRIGQLKELVRACP